MTAPQFGEPWVIEEIPREAGYYRILNRHGQSGEPIRTHGDPSRMVRVVACVNALAGVVHPERLGDLLAAFQRLKDGHEIWLTDGDIPEKFKDDPRLSLRQRMDDVDRALAALTDDVEVGA